MRKQSCQCEKMAKIWDRKYGKIVKIYAVSRV